ncbi:exlusion protein FxsA [Vibrio cholerae]|nr:exlusion protein FxsA [Vibrio cholerae]
MSTRGVSSPNESRWLRLLCLSLVVIRCQPLRRALYSLSLRKLSVRIECALSLAYNR